MTRTVNILQFIIIPRQLRRVAYNYRYRCAEGTPVEDAGKYFRFVRFSPGRRNAAPAGSPPVQVAPYRINIQAQASGAAVNDTAHRRPVRFAKRNNPESPPKTVTAHGNSRILVFGYGRKKPAAGPLQYPGYIFFYRSISGNFG
jgi:hypothetical protein